jgi:hypothetical protein
MTRHRFSRTSNPDQHISDHELAAMTAQLDQTHQDQALPALRSAVAEWTESLRAATDGPTARLASRRTFLLGAAGVGAGGALLAALGPAAPAFASTGLSAGRLPEAAKKTALKGDLAVAATAASLENLGVYAYKAGLAAVTAGKFTAPPAVATFAMTAMKQHQDHAAAWNSALTAAGQPAVTATDPALTPTVNTAFGKVTSAAGLAQLALLIETIAAQTYQGAIPELSASSSVAVAASIHPVEMQHAAILYYVLGRYPGVQGTKANMYASGTPLAFSPNTLARPATDYTGR